MRNSIMDTETSKSAPTKKKASSSQFWGIKLVSGELLFSEVLGMTPMKKDPASSIEPAKIMIDLKCPVTYRYFAVPPNGDIIHEWLPWPSPFYPSKKLSIPVESSLIAWVLSDDVVLKYLSAVQKIGSILEEEKEYIQNIKDGKPENNIDLSKINITGKIN